MQRWPSQGSVSRESQMNIAMIGYKHRRKCWEQRIIKDQQGLTKPNKCSRTPNMCMIIRGHWQKKRGLWSISGQKAHPKARQTFFHMILVLKGFCPWDEDTDTDQRFAGLIFFQSFQPLWSRERKQGGFENSVLVETILGAQKTLKSRHSSSGLQKWQIRILPTETPENDENDVTQAKGLRHGLEKAGSDFRGVTGPSQLDLPLPRTWFGSDSRTEQGGASHENSMQHLLRRKGEEGF